MILFALIISLVTCSIAIMSDYQPNEPKRFQMLLYWLKKPIIDHHNKVEENYNKELKKANEYYSSAIRGLEALDDNGEPIYTQEQKDARLKYWMMMQSNKQEWFEVDKENKLAYEFYLKPIILCVYCMPSFWGTILWVAHIGFNNPIEWITTIVMSVFINAILWNIYLKLNDNN
jgi:hypothetical protein